MVNWPWMVIVSYDPGKETGSTQICTPEGKHTCVTGVVAGSNPFNCIRLEMPGYSDVPHLVHPSESPSFLP